MTRDFRKDGSQKQTQRQGKGQGVGQGVGQGASCFPPFYERLIVIHRIIGHASSFLPQDLCTTIPSTWRRPLLELGEAASALQ